MVALGAPPPTVEVADGDHVTCTVEEAGALCNQIIAEPGAGICFSSYWRSKTGAMETADLSAFGIDDWLT